MCDGGYSGELGAQNKSVIELNFRGSVLTVMKQGRTTVAGGVMRSQGSSSGAQD